jgi:WD40 repeat protein
MTGNNKVIFGTGEDEPEEDNVYIVNINTGRKAVKYRRATIAAMLLRLNLLALEKDYGDLVIWNCRSNKRVCTLQDNFGDRRIECAFFPDGRQIVTALYHDSIRIWDTQSGKEIFSWKTPDLDVEGVACSPDGLLIAVADSIKKLVRVWNSSSGIEVACLGEHRGFTKEVAFSPDGQWIIVGDAEGEITIWDARDARRKGSHRMHDGIVTCLTPVWGESVFASGGTDGQVKIWTIFEGSEVAEVVNHSHDIKSIAFSSDGRYLITGADRFDETVRLWSSVSGIQLACVSGHNTWTFSNAGTTVAISPDGRFLAMAAAHPNPDRSPDDDPDEIFSFGKVDLGYIQVFSLESLNIIAQTPAENSCISTVAFSPDGSKIAGAHDFSNPFIYIYDAITGRQLHRLSGHGHPVNNVEFSPDGQRLVSSSGDGTVRTWDIQNESELMRFVHPPHETIYSNFPLSHIHFAAFFKGGQRIASAGIDGTTRVWDIETKQCVKVFENSNDRCAVEAVVRSQPFCLKNADLESVLVNLHNSDSVAWFPTPLIHVTMHPDGTLWAGANRMHLYLLALENEWLQD